MSKLKKFIASETVLVAAFLAALVSMIFVPPNEGYADYIDFPVIIMLFCLLFKMECSIRKKRKYGAK